MSKTSNRRAPPQRFARVLCLLMLSWTTSCAPPAIEVRSRSNDCAWAAPLYLGEDAIAALADRERELSASGEYERAVRLRLDRKSIGDNNRLFEDNCGAKPEAQGKT